MQGFLIRTSTNESGADKRLCVLMIPPTVSISLTPVSVTLRPPGRRRLMWLNLHFPHLPLFLLKPGHAGKIRVNRKGLLSSYCSSYEVHSEEKRCGNPALVIVIGACRRSLSLPNHGGSIFAISRYPSKIGRFKHIYVCRTTSAILRS